MKASELRIGNWVNAIRYRDDSGKFYLTQIETLSKGWGTINGKSKYTICMNHGFYETGSEWGQTIENENQVKPIPLTEEWLKKFGFKSDNYTDEDRSLIYIKKINEIEDFIIDRGFYLMDIDISIQIKYVHQLQNLFFALTQKELTI